MALAVHLKIILLTLALCSSVFNMNPALGATIVGSNVSIAAQASTRERFYLNTAKPAPTNGTITHLRYCYYGREDDNRNTYQALMALYRLEQPRPGSRNYRRIMDTVSIVKRAPLSRVPSADALLPGFSCDSVELERSVQVLLGDVIGACIYDTLINSIRQLDVVSRSDNGYRMLYNSADDEDCENGILPEVVGSNLEQTSIPRILHVFAEILSTNVEIRNDSGTTVTMSSTSRDQLQTTGAIIGGLAIVAIATTMMIIITAVACFLIKKQKQRNNYSGYNYTINLTYNVRGEQVDNQDENEHDSSSQPPSTVPYYDYIEDGTPQPPRSVSREEAISCSTGCSDSMEPNRAYNTMAHQVAGLWNAGDPSHSMVYNQA